jgi:hypothetical protein
MALAMPSKFLTSLFLGMWLYSLALWGWIALNYYLLPAYQYGPLSIYVPVPQNLVADLAFPASFVFFVIWNYLRKRQ